MGRLVPFIILISLIGLVAYAGFQSFSLIKKQPVISQISLPKFNLSLPKIFSKSTPGPTDIPQVTLFPTPTPNPGINSYLQTNILGAASTCVHQLLGQDDSNYYLWAICKNPSSSLSIPVALKLNLSSHRIPRAGEFYSKDLKTIFPDHILSLPIFSNPELLTQLEKSLP